MKGQHHHESLAVRERHTIWRFDASDDLRIAELKASDFVVLLDITLGGRQRIELAKSAPQTEETTAWPRQGFRW